MWNLFRLIRITNLIILLLTQFLVFVCLPEAGCFSEPFSLNFLILATASIFLAAAGYAINDYFDVKIDLINKPSRLLIGKKVKRREAILVHILLNFIGISAGFYLSIKVGVFFTFIAFLLLVYSTTFKRKLLSGNILIAFLMALGPVTVWLYNPAIDEVLVTFYAIFAFLTGFIREIIKDIEDWEGDAEFNCRTLPIVFGQYPAKMTAFSIGIIFQVFLGVFIWYLVKNESLLMGAYHFLVIFVQYIFVQIKILNSDRKKHFTELSNYLKLIMALGTIGMLTRCIII